MNHRSGISYIDCIDGYELYAGLCNLVHNDGVTVERRGQMVREIVGPTVARLRDPTLYVPLHPMRKLNPWTMLAEFPWLMAGRNDIRWLLPYLPGAAQFSDNSITWRAGYGPRLRGRNGNVTTAGVDQVGQVIKQLLKDPFTRQAIISLWDAELDSIVGSRDYPCTQTLHFMCAPDGHLDLYVHMRSNDVFWGCTGVNVPNFCLLLMLVAAATGLEVGEYYHTADNMHIYERHFDAMGRTSTGGLLLSTFRSNPYPIQPLQWGAHPPMRHDELEHLERAMHMVEHYKQRHTAQIMPETIANAMVSGATPDQFAVQWAHFMLLWDLVNDTPRRRFVADRPGDAPLAIHLDQALAAVQWKPWRLAAAMWMARTDTPLSVELGTQHIHDILGRGPGGQLLGGLLEEEHAQ